MTLNEICKALECCSTDASLHSCEGCPYNNGDDSLSCVDIVAKDAIALIKKQRAEIKQLKKRDEKAIGEEAVKNFIEQLIERTKGILLDDETLVEIIDELLRSK